MSCILRAVRCLLRGSEYGNETSGTTESHRLLCRAGCRRPGAAGHARPGGPGPGRDTRHPRSDARRPCALGRRGHRATPRWAGQAAHAGTRRDGPGESSLRSGSAGRPGRLPGGVPEQRFHKSPDLLVLRGQALPTAPVPRQTVPAGAVRSDRSGHSRLQHSRRNAGVSAGHRCAVLRPHGCTGSLVGGCCARPLPGHHLAPATAREPGGPRARADRRRRRPCRPDAASAEITAAGADRGPSALVGLLRRAMPNFLHLQRTLGRSAATLTLLALVATGRAADWQMSLDTRLVTSDAGRSFMDGGLGTTRFDRNDSGVQLGRARLALSAPLGELWSVHLDASLWDDKDRSPVGVTEAYLQFRPYPRAGYRLRVKAGAFYPPISLENRAAGWESPYTLSYSAINTWLGVEVRTIGLEAQLDWLGTRTGHDFDLGLTAGAFRWNVYAGVEGRYLDRVVLRVLRYDNRADPTQIDTVSGAIAWDTRFNSAGLRVESSTGWTGILQWLDGETIIAPPGVQLVWPFRAQFALLSKRFGRQTLSARYDRFKVDSSVDGSYQSGHAWTAAWLFDADAHWRVALEWLRVRSNSYYRA